MAAHDLFMEAANRYAPRPGEASPAGVRSFADMQEVARAIIAPIPDADPINNIYNERLFDTAPRPRQQANRYGRGANDYNGLIAYAQAMNYGTQMLISRKESGSFSSTDQVKTRISEAHAVGAILSLFVSAARELSNNADTPKDIAAGLNFATRYENEVQRLYRRNADLLRRINPSLDEIVAFVNREHKILTGSELSGQHRNVIRGIANLGRLTIKLNGNGGNGHTPKHG